MFSSRKDYTQPMTYAMNVLRTYMSANDDEIAAGMSWYDNANSLALELSPDNVWRGAGVIAAFSPRVKWDQNVILARRAFKEGIASGHTTAMCNIANRILNGEHPLDVMRGEKTRAFTAAIADPANSTIATIDRHAYNIATGENVSEPKIGKRLYRELSAAYVDAAKVAGIGVAQIQAITWVKYRNDKGIK